MGVDERDDGAELESETDEYILNDQDNRILNATKGLLWKIARSRLVTPGQLLTVAKLLNVLERLPRQSVHVTARVSLGGPERWYGEHRIRHWWEVEVRPDEITISSGGVFHTDTIGSDSFTCLHWFAKPGCETDCTDYWEHHRIVDDAQPFEDEVAAIDLAAEKYSLTVDDDSDDSA